MENDRPGQRWATWMLWKEGVTGAEIVRRLKTVCAEGAPCEKTVYNWLAQFRDGKGNTDDAARSGRPASAVTQENIELVEQLVADDRRITVAELCACVAIGRAAIDTILHEHLHVTKVTARWVPRLLTPDMKRQRVECSRQLLGLAAAEGPLFLQKLVTGDESWFHYYDPDSRRDSMEWRHPGEAPPTKPRAVRSAGKRMATVFWDIEGILLLKWLPEGESINSKYYCEVLAELREAIKRERRGKLSRGVVLLHDNARPHTSNETLAAIQAQGFTTLPHPPYSPDLAPSDFWLFGQMKRALRGRRFETLQQLATAVSKWRQDTPTEWFAAGLEKLCDRWTSCVQRRGDFVEVPSNDDQ